HTTLLLGARSGRLFHSAQFYELLRPSSHRNFYQLSVLAQFQECYAILTNDKLDEWDLHKILQASLKNTGMMNADICLASLIKDEYFDEIISTNIDDGLEDALLQAEMREGQDYELIQIGQNPSVSNYVNKGSGCRIIKLYGDLASRDYIVKGR